MRLFPLYLMFLGVVLNTGCTEFDPATCVGTLCDQPPQPSFDGQSNDGQSNPSSTEISCETTTDCNNGETCINQICQMAPCQQTSHQSQPPLGEFKRFKDDQELIVIGNTTMTSYAPTLFSIDPLDKNTPEFSDKIVDVAGGRFETRYENLIATIVEDTPILYIQRDSNQILNLDFIPVAIASGDIDNDDLDEIIVLSSEAQMAICDIDRSTCENHALPRNTKGIDLDVADLDRDEYQEIIFLLTIENIPTLLVWNADSAITEQPDQIKYIPETSYQRIAAGDLDGDGQAEIVALQDSEFVLLPFFEDAVHLYHITGRTLTQIDDFKIDRSSIDLTTADSNGDDRHELFILHNENKVDHFEWTGITKATKQYTSTLNTSGTGLVAFDIDNDSSYARLIVGPELVSAEVVPLTVMFFPPYSSTYSDSESTIIVGETDGISEHVTESIYLSTGFEIGVNVEFAGIGASLATDIKQETLKIKSQTSSQFVGTTYYSSAEPERFGTEDGLVALASGCFHNYIYEVFDPLFYLSEESEGAAGSFSLLFPVGGTVTQWSLNRYNAMAQYVPHLPIIRSNHQIGVLDSYALEPETLTGLPVSPEDNIFKERTTLAVSDRATSRWALQIRENTTTEKALLTSLGIKGNIKVPGFTFGVNTTEGWGKGYGLSIGSRASFGGSIPPIVDDQTTPENEYNIHKYSFSPYVYRERYTDLEGNDAAFYVMNYILVP